MIELRPYQDNIVSKILDFFHKGKKHAIVSAPTGAGKTIIFSYIAQKIQAKNNKVLVFTDRTELLTQAGGSFRKFGINPTSIKAGTKYLNTNNNCYIAMSQTYKRRMKNPVFVNFLKSVDLIIIDEAHKQEFNYLFESGFIDNIPTLGFTATPSRSGKMRQLALDYEEIIDEVTVQDLLDMGYLVQDEYYGVMSADTTNLKVSGLKGDFDEKEQFQRFNSAKLYAGAFSQWKDIAYNTQTIIFCVNIEHCIKTCEEFQKNGVDARFVVSEMGIPKKPLDTDSEGKFVIYEEKMRIYNLYKDSFGKWSGDRNRITKKFKNSEFPVLINAGIFTTGFDAPNIETVMMLRATISVTLWLQIIGRGSRLNGEYKTHFNILDFGENAKRLGHYSQNRKWSLWHSDKSGDGVPPVKECGVSDGKPIKSNKPGCKRLLMASIKICPFCGFKYPEKKATVVELSQAFLDKESKTTVYVKRVSEMNNDELYDYFKNKRHKSPWLWRQLYFRGGESLIRSFGASKGWKPHTISTAVRFIRNISNKK